MLALYIAEAEGRVTPAPEIWELGEVSAMMGGRWVKVLIQRGLIEIEGPGTLEEGGGLPIRLSATGHALMEKQFDELLSWHDSKREALAARGYSPGLSRLKT